MQDDALVAAIRQDPQSAPISAAERALLAFADKLTRTPGRMGQADVEQLRKLGWHDRAIHDAVQVIAYFNYINRIADGLGVDLEPDMPPRPAHPDKPIP